MKDQKTMNETKHTPGPWHSVPRKNPEHEHLTRIDFEVMRPDSSGMICAIAVGGDALGRERNRAEHEANARLIAAAPELLEACKRLLAVIEEGRNHACQEPIMANPTVAAMQTAGGAVFAGQDAIAKAEGAL